MHNNLNLSPMPRQKLMRTLGRAAFVIGAALLLAVVAQPFGAPSLAAGSGGTSQIKYVSMGSSYAAGPGVGTRDEQSGKCDRSLSNYAQQLKARRHLNLVDVSCSGATTDNILKSSQNSFPPQIDKVDADTRLVTVTIGGNDVKYIENLLGYSCRDNTHGAKCSDVVSDAVVDMDFQHLPGSLKSVVHKVHQRAPKARLVIIDYLPVLPSGASGCPDVPLSPTDLGRMQAIYSRLTHVIDDVPQDKLTTVLRSSMIGSGHDACSAQPFVTAYQSRVSYHPNQDGMDRLASALDETLGAGLDQ